ncbi:unnamed protein product [Thelazia callipaeda]|uniref:Uncharacterized protein n=1 Tax=Thelazia callipaeda TaxID=103827 RepID=A0A0N5CZE5_THECL|nr:unnamed protein product [Thelazia callipaeda]
MVAAGGSGKDIQGKKSDAMLPVIWSFGQNSDLHTKMTNISIWRKRYSLESERKGHSATLLRQKFMIEVLCSIDKFDRNLIFVNLRN